MQESNRVTIDPYYKKGNVFERDEAYYSQMLTGTRRTNLRGSRNNSQSRMQSNDRSVNRVSANGELLYSQTNIIDTKDNRDRKIYTE